MIFGLMSVLFIVFLLCADAGNSSDWMHRKAKGTFRDSKGGEENE